MSGERLAAEPIERRIERSSFGTAAARQCWQRTSFVLADEILARVAWQDYEFDERLLAADSDEDYAALKAAGVVDVAMVEVWRAAERLAEGSNDDPEAQGRPVVRMFEVKRYGDRRTLERAVRQVERFAQQAFGEQEGDHESETGGAGAESFLVVWGSAEAGKSSVLSHDHYDYGLEPARLLRDGGAYQGPAAASEPEPFDLDAFYRRHFARVRAACRVLVPDADADDVAQEVFIRAMADRPWERLDQNQLAGWLLHRAQRMNVEFQRRSATLRLVDEFDETAALIPDPAPGPETLALQGERQALVADALEGLSPEDRRLIMLSTQDLSRQQMAKMLDMTTKRVYVRLHRAHRRLEESLGALLVGRHGATRCRGLGELLAGWDGRLRPMVRKRIVRHIAECAACDELRRRATSPEQLL